MSLAPDLRPLAKAFENADMHVVITDALGFVMYANEAAEKHTGYSQADMIGKKPGQVWGGLMPPEFYKEMWETIAQHKQCYVGNLRNKRKNGEDYWQEVHIIPVVDSEEQPKYYIGIELNVNDESERDALLGSYVISPSASEDLQVRWPVEWLFDAGHLSQDQLLQMEEFYEKGGAVDSVTEDLIAISHVQFAARQKPEMFSLSALIEQILRSVQTIYPRNAYIFTGGKEKTQIEQNKLLLTQVLQRIITNASQYCKPEHGEVTVSIVVLDDSCTIRVQDNGMGIPEHDQPHIFRKFYRGNQARTANPIGSGLGLYIVKLIADTMRWSLSFLSSPDKGTVFRLTIPMRQNERK